MDPGGRYNHSVNIFSNTLIKSIFVERQVLKMQFVVVQLNPISEKNQKERSCISKFLTVIVRVANIGGGVGHNTGQC